MSYQEITARMIEGDKENQAMFAEIDAMYNMEWSLPTELLGLEGVRKEVSPDPHDSIRAGTRVLAAVKPRIKIAPLHDNEETKRETDRLERFVGWHLENANRRRGNNIADIVKHSIMYARAAAQVVYLPSQASSAGFFKNDARRKKAAERYGPFAVIPRDPRNVFAEWSDWGLERVVHRNIMRAHEVVDFWGSSKLKAQLKKNEDLQYCTVYDYQDYNRRVVWCMLQGRNTNFAHPDAKAITLLDEETKTEFLPWVVRDTGRQLIPMLYSIVKTGQWDSQNLYETIMSTEVIKLARMPRDMVRSPDPESVTTDEVEGRVELMPDEDYQRLNPYEIDQKLLLVSDRIHTRMARSTIPDIVQSGTVPEGIEAFSAINLMQESGLKSLTPYKELAEEVIAGIVRLMFEWIDYEGETQVAYPTQGNGLGEVIRVSPDDFDPKHLYIDVELTADVPTDRMQRINAAVTAHERLGLSKKRALEDINITDPNAELDQYYEERKREDDYVTAVEMERQQLAMQIQMEFEQQQMQNQQAMMQQQPQGPGQPPTMGAAKGMNVNPAMGGQPPANFDQSINRITQARNNGTQLGGQ